MKGEVRSITWQMNDGEEAFYGYKYVEGNM